MYCMHGWSLKTQSMCSYQMCSCNTAHESALLSYFEIVVLAPLSHQYLLVLVRIKCPEMPCPHVLVFLQVCRLCLDKAAQSWRAVTGY